MTNQPSEELNQFREWQKYEAELGYRRELKAIEAELASAEAAARHQRAAAEKYYQQELYRIANPRPASMQFRASYATYTVVIGDVPPGTCNPFCSVNHDHRIITLDTKLIGIGRHDAVKQSLVEAAIHLNPGNYAPLEIREIKSRIEATMDEDYERQGGAQRLTYLLPPPAEFKKHRKSQPKKGI